MRADFLDAHKRHWDDAERLMQAGRLANADHLYGMAAECGLKQLMLAFGMALDPRTGKPTDRNDWVHANNIWPRYESYRSGRIAGADYALPSQNPFNQWDVSDRYANQAGFQQHRVHRHQAGAQAVRNLIGKAQREGML